LVTLPDMIFVGSQNQSIPLPLSPSYPSSPGAVYISLLNAGVGKVSSAIALDFLGIDKLFLWY